MSRVFACLRGTCFVQDTTAECVYKYIFEMSDLSLVCGGGLICHGRLVSFWFLLFFFELLIFLPRMDFVMLVLVILAVLKRAKGLRFRGSCACALVMRIKTNFENQHGLMIQGLSVLTTSGGAYSAVFCTTCNIITGTYWRR